ncbi:acetyltransferase [Purpureocillium lavendulum]|uniref:Acetyltransferase n=1 Tax=Purpureocillium lavendulum TaxID=1247861 RepID=A0AB34FV29_9HYPO|nr:acetyltransferase [Purpureocillium lavendulum]
MMVQGAGLQSPHSAAALYPGAGAVAPTPASAPAGVPQTTTPDIAEPAAHAGRKRKADSQDNERLSKRLSLLNLGMVSSFCESPTGPVRANSPSEKNGSKLYVPVETASPAAAPRTPVASRLDHDGDDDVMQVDDSKHKVYIYNIDDELSSDSETDDGKLVFLPDIEKHLRQNRIPPHVLANSEGELAGMQMVLYSDPKSLSVPEDRDGVRKAIIESRRRVRELQRQEREGVSGATMTDDVNSGTSPAVEANTSQATADDDMMDMD